jgi:hypothetical protein
MNMRDLMTLVEAAGSASGAMFWITDDGRLLDCSGWTHEDVAQREIPEAGDASIAAYRAGWIRVMAASGIFGADWMDGRPTPEALAELRTLLRDLPEYDTYYLNDGGPVLSKRLVVSKAARLRP